MRKDSISHVLDARGARLPRRGAIILAQGPAGFSDPFFESLMLDTSAGYGLRRRQDAQKMLKKGKKRKIKKGRKKENQKGKKGKSHTHTHTHTHTQKHTKKRVVVVVEQPKNNPNRNKTQGKTRRFLKTTQFGRPFFVFTICFRHRKSIVFLGKKTRAVLGRNTT